MIFVSFPSAKDPLWDKKFPNKSTCEIVFPMNDKWFNNFSKDLIPRHRGDEYDNLKEKIFTKLYSQLLELYPQVL